MIESESGSLVFEKKFSMRVGAKILQSISTGIYRTPANAIKELVNNAFDADAPKVDINIEFQGNNVKSISIRDNGTGIHPNDFEFSMTHIGASLKRLSGDYTPKRRPIIGRIGIGLLAVGQASHKFTFKSATKESESVMVAQIDLSPYYDAIQMTKSLDELEVGNVEIFKEEKTNPKDSFTEISLDAIGRPFSKDLTQLPKYKNKNFSFQNNQSYQEFVDWIDKIQLKRDEELSGFNRFMLELGLLTPVAYLKNGPIRGYSHGVIAEIKNRLEKYNFKVFVNNVEIFKPIVYPFASDDLTEKGKDYKVYELDLNEKLPNGKKLIAKGYFYHQAKRLLPWTFRGMLLRVNNAGVGTYENRFSKIPIETPIVLQQFSGELYVDQGLDDALNIDRNSFFESESAYQILHEHYQAWIRKIAQDIGKRMDSRQKESKSEKQKEKEREIKNKVKSMAMHAFSKVDRVSMSVGLDPFSTPKVILNRSDNSLNIRVTLPRPRKTSDDVLIQILIAAQIAIEKGRDKRGFNTIFSELLEKLEL